jgi:hypothetical protein
MKVYVIKGASGEWSDSVNWLTFAYKTKGVAEIICSYLNELKKRKFIIRVRMIQKINMMN